MRNKNASQHNNKKSMLPIKLNVNGATGLVDPSTIPSSQWESHHGSTPAGIKVNSLKSVDINESIIFERTDGFQFSVDKNDWEVAAVQRLTRLGYKIQAPTA